MSDITYVKERPQNATATIKGIVRLAGDLGGTADAPTVVHISPSVTVGLVSGGTGADLSATGPGVLVQASDGVNVTVTTTPALGTPSAAVLTNATGLPTAGLVDAAVTLAKMANLAQDQFIGRTTASTGVPQTATITAAARTVLDDTTVSAMVDTLGGASASGSGGLVRATSATLVTPVLGVATATSINKVAVTAPATSATLTIADGKTLTINDTMTLVGAYTLTIPATGTAALLATANVFTATQTSNVGEGSVGFALQADGNVRAEIGTFSTASANAGFVRLRDASAITVVIDSRTDTAARHSYINNTSNFGLGTSTPTGGKLYVDQTSATGAIPVLYLDQGDADQDFIELVGGSSTGNATSISTDAAGAYAGRVQITVNGTRRWISFTADA